MAWRRHHAQPSRCYGAFICFFVFCFFLSALAVNPRAPGVLNKLSTTAISPKPFCRLQFESESQLLPRLALNSLCSPDFNLPSSCLSTLSIWEGRSSLVLRTPSICFHSILCSSFASIGTVTLAMSERPLWPGGNACCLFG